MTNEELFHYGVEGMRWGHRKNIPIRVKRAYHNWRINSHERDANRYAKRAEKTEFKSWANPSYVLKKEVLLKHIKIEQKHMQRLKLFAIGISRMNKQFMKYPIVKRLRMARSLLTTFLTESM